MATLKVWLGGTPARPLLPGEKLPLGADFCQFQGGPVYVPDTCEPQAQTYDVPRTFGPFPIPERKRTFSPDDAKLFRLLCGLTGETPARQFRKLVRAALQAELGNHVKNPKAKAAAEALFGNSAPPLSGKPLAGGPGSQS